MAEPSAGAGGSDGPVPALVPRLDGGSGRARPLGRLLRPPRAARRGPRSERRRFRARRSRAGHLSRRPGRRARHRRDGLGLRWLRDRVERSRPHRSGDRRSGTSHRVAASPGPEPAIIEGPVSAGPRRPVHSVARAGTRDRRRPVTGVSAPATGCRVSPRGRRRTRRVRRSRRRARPSAAARTGRRRGADRCRRTGSVPPMPSPVPSWPNSASPGPIVMPCDARASERAEHRDTPGSRT